MITTMRQYQQEPVAIVGFACRLPGGSHTPQRLWELLERGDIASNKVPKTRFNIGGHYDGSQKPGTMRPKGGMFLEDVDLARFDASFFEIGGTEAIAMDPNQRQMLEVVYEGLENAGIPLEKINGTSVGCFVGSYSSDYGDMQNRDAEDRPANIAIGVGRSIMANRLSHFFNVKGPSITIDTACSGSLVCLDLACRSIQAGEIDTAIVAASNLYLNPEHVMDVGSVGQAQSPTALCHTFDKDADGYVKAEAVSCFVVRRLSEALRDRDPIRAIVRGTASNSNGRTAGIASPSSVAQAAAIQAAYANAGISNFNETAYLECHGTGTQAGDPTEVDGVGSVFAYSRAVDQPLIIGSIKSNVGHAEPAAGNSGLIKVIMSIEKGMIPGSPTFIKPSPKINFAGNKVKAIRTVMPWPDCGYPIRRASINSFGMGGSNAHAIIDQPSIAARSSYVCSYKVTDYEEDDFFGEDENKRPHILVLSANDATSLKANIQALCKHLMNPRVKADLANLAYTLSEHRTRLWHRAFVTTKSTEIEEKDFVVSKHSGQPPKIAMVFTGQGAQWPQMGKAMLEVFPWTQSILEELDRVLWAKKNPPEWSIVVELTEPRGAEHMRQPELSQTLVTALQLCIVAVLESWGIKPSSVIGHSSGEIAAAYAAGLLDRASAITAAFYRGRAAKIRKGESEANVGMLAVGVSAKSASLYVEKYPGIAWIACFNSPDSVTISGRQSALEAICEDIKADGHFARLLNVDFAYHSPFMNVIGEEYFQLLTTDQTFQPLGGSPDVTMFSSTTASKRETATDSMYWRTNLQNQVRFDEALRELMLRSSPSMLIEIGPSGALAGPISNILQALPFGGVTSYYSSWSRDADAAKSLLNIAGQIFVTGAPVDMSLVNAYDMHAAKTIVDLPNYSWNHSVKYWHENAASRDWRFKQFITHELLGSKIPGTLWSAAPTWRKHLNLADVPWLRDHLVGPDILMPGAGYITLALEAMYQTHCTLNPDSKATLNNELAYRFRNVKFQRAMVIEEDKPTTIMLTLTKAPSSKNWHEFRIQTVASKIIYEHCVGMVRVQDPIIDEDVLTDTDRATLRHPQPSRLWYKAQREVGMAFGPSFQKIESIESVKGSRTCRSILSLEPPASKWKPASYYPLHPAVLDACFQTVHPANVCGERSRFKDIIIPAFIDDMVINKMPRNLQKGLSLAHSEHKGRGREDVAKSWGANISVHDLQTGELIVRVKQLSYTRLDGNESSDPHVFHATTWKPDISLLAQDQLTSLLPFDRGDVAQIDFVIDLAAYKTPKLKVLEINFDGADTSCLWFQGGENAIRAAYSQYDFLSTGSKTVATVKETHESMRNAKYHLMASTRNAFNVFSVGKVYDLVILKASKTCETLVEDMAKDLERILEPNALVLFVCQNELVSNSVSLLDAPNGRLQNGRPKAHHTTPVPNGCDPNTLKVTASLDPMTFKEDSLVDSLFSSLKGAAIRIGKQRAWLLNRASVGTNISGPQSHVEIARFDAVVPAPTATLIAKLKESRRSVCTTPVETLDLESYQASTSTVLVLDELSNSVLTQISKSQWEALKRLICTGKPLLWVTKGAQTSEVTNPDNALIQGLFRTIRRERPDANLTILDVESAKSPATDIAIEQVLLRLQSGIGTETEYTERNGILLIERIMPDSAINSFKAAESGKGLETVVKNFYDAEALVRLQAERVGTLESLTWCETSVERMPLEPETVEIEVMAVGVNFKDVAITMGLVPDNEHMIGCECAGYIKRLPPDVTKFNVGDRVVAQRNGAFANRIQCPIDRVHVFPTWMSFEDAATIPLVYLTTIYALYHLANLTEGQTVLIHSAAGGVGLAAIQLAQYKKADVFVTVSTDEKRDFLANTFGIPSSHMCNSRNTTFAKAIRHQTNDRGIDIILNSLTGELLDESWRLLADGGVMIEIGKKDIIDRNLLSMEPFDRNCSFRAVDLSYTRHITHRLIGRLLDEIFCLLEGGHIKPIHPVTKFGFDQVIPALTYMKRGQHIGKIVVSSGDQKDVQIPVKPVIRRFYLRPNATYLIVGGLKGLCGSVAVHMAQHGARHLIIMSRTGLDDEASARTIEDCAAYQCEICEAKGDVGDIDFVRRVFQSSQTRRIAGVVQGAMVLRDKPFEMMTHDEYRSVIRAKIAGTWNLHRAAQEESERPLDFFTMLSSISGVVGNKGQANYAAANTFLDAFARYRQSLRLRANTVDLGAVEDVGYIAEQGSTLETRLDRRQWIPINEETLRKIMSYSVFQQDNNRPLSDSSSAQLITGLAYPLTEGSTLAGDPRFAYLFNSHGDGCGNAVGDNDGSNVDQAIKTFRTMLASGADAGTLAEVVLDLLRSQVTKLLLLETEIEPGRPLMAYGLDSLSAVELRGWVRQKLGAELSTLDITNASSLIALSEKLTSKLLQFRGAKQ